MKEVQLTKGMVALVDDEDYENLSSISWCFDNHGYAKGCHKMKTVRMHRLILKPTDPRAVIDHIDGNKLNNCKSNLRICTHQENNRNKKKKSGTSSQYKGVIWEKQYKKWRAQYRKDRKAIYLGKFDNEVDAARAYNEAVSREFGEFAKLNEIPY